MNNATHWGKLLLQNRVKAVGIAWSKEEWDAIHVEGIDPDDVRAGILTKKDLEEAKNDPNKSLRLLKKGELLEKAKELGVLVTDDEAVSKNDLIVEIQQAEEKKASENNA